MNDAGIAPKVGDQPLQFTPLLQLLSQDMDNLTRHADFKAQIILAINAILTATAVGQASTLPSDGGLGLLAFTCGIVTLGLMIGSVYFSLRTVLPRNVDPHDTPLRNLFFYADISTLTEEEYTRRFLGQSLPELRDAMLAQVYAKSHVIEAKFVSVRRAIGLLFWAVAIWLVGRIFAAFV
jgi:hypothetical protein